jgi:hypothetical protein
VLTAKNIAFLVFFSGDCFFVGDKNHFLPTGTKLCNEKNGRMITPKSNDTWDKILATATEHYGLSVDASGNGNAITGNQLT